MSGVLGEKCRGALLFRFAGRSVGLESIARVLEAGQSLAERGVSGDRIRRGYGDRNVIELDFLDREYFPIDAAEWPWRSGFGPDRRSSSRRVLRG